MNRGVFRPLTLLIAACVVLAGTFVSGQQALVRVEDAFVIETSSGWTIGTSGIRYSLTRGTGSIGIGAIQDPVGATAWQRGTGTDSSIVIDGQRVAVGGALTHLQGVETREWNGGVRLDLNFVLRSPAEQVAEWYNDANRGRGVPRSPGSSSLAGNVRIVRSYAVYPGSSVVETWTTLTVTGNKSVTVSDLNAYTVSVRNGTLNWVNGLQASDSDGGPFTRLSGDLEEGQVFELGSERRASEQALPFYSVTVNDEEFFGAMLWSGSWRFRVERHQDALAIRLGMPPFATNVPAGGSLETPHAVFGLTNRNLPETSIALRRFIEVGLRHGRPLRSYVSYNTWYSYGTFMDEASMFAEMALAASVGVEQFVIDAGWWFHINADDQADYVRNWGNWLVDPERFPNGLGVLTDRAHELGMRFGVWVEPERVDLMTISRAGGAPERILASDGGRYDPGSPNSSAVSAQVCLASGEAREWVLDKLVSFIDDVRPDYLKWDNNLWINCNRPGHGHTTGDGNFRHHQGLATVLDSLRERFPELDIENCSTGGNRLSLEMLARSDMAWVDDRTDSSTRVRHSFGGLAAMFPPSYLLSFAVGLGEGIDGVQVGGTNYVTRSRMLGAWGLSLPLASLDDGGREELARQIAIYKDVRPILESGSAVLLGAQTPGPGQPWSGWDAVQFITRDAREVAVLAYSSFDAGVPALVRLKGLSPDATYRVETPEAGSLGFARGSDLMGIGLELQPSAESVGHIVVLRAE